MFKRRQIYILTSLARVCEACCIDAATLRGSRSRDATDARWVLVQALRGVASDADIGAMLGRTRQGVCHLRNDAARSRDRVLRTIVEEIRASNEQAKD